VILTAKEGTKFAGKYIRFQVETAKFSVPSVKCMVRCSFHPDVQSVASMLPVTPRIKKEELFNVD